MKIILKRSNFCIARIVLSYFIFVLLSSGIEFQNAYSFPSDNNATIYFKNITRSKNQFEINPRFVENGANVVFLVFTGNQDAPKPWDYILAKADRDGHKKYFLNTSGVIDYNVLPDETGIIVLKVLPSIQNNEINDGVYCGIKKWELMYVNLQSGEEMLLESSMGLPVSEGYKMLGMIDSFNLNRNQFIMNSPLNTSHILLRREQSEDYEYFNFSLLEINGKQNNIFKTESWKSYSEVIWHPTMVWLSETKLITITFNSIFDKNCPQSAGMFSIVSIDLIDKSTEILHSDSTIKPFPKFVLNPSLTELYFQGRGKENKLTELWKLNLRGKSVERIFSVEGDIGDVRFSPDGSSIVLTQLMGNNFDIIRIDLFRNQIQQLAGK